MKDLKNKYKATGRREFISKLSLTAAVGLMGSSGLNGAWTKNLGEAVTTKQVPDMPVMNLGPYQISRLICGCNPMLGYSYLGSHTDRQMKEYFTIERVVEFLQKCEEAGITMHQSSFRLDYFNLLRESGSKMQIINLQSKRENIREVIATARPAGIVHHGGVTDRLFAEGSAGKVHDFVKEVKDNGLLAGVSAHNPDVIKKIADEGWDVDFFMTCFYYLTRKEGMEAIEKTELPVGSYHFLKDDPTVMTAVIRQVKQPCLAFKILGAGRKCATQEDVRAAFKFAFENIKPIDGVIVGMFPWFFDEIEANVQYTKEFGKL
jgi:hypothetical protein